MKKLVLSTLFVLQTVFVFAQSGTGITGVVLDSKTKKPLQGVLASIENTNFTKLTDEKGVFVLQSNSSSKFIQEMYSDFKIVEVDCSRNINSNGGKRGKVKEYLILGNTLNRYYQQ